MLTIKGSSIVIKTEQDVQEVEAKLAQIQIQYIPFVVFTLTTTINKLIIDPIQDIMRRAGVSEKVIQRTYLDVKAVKTEDSIIFSIKSDYISESGFDVAGMIENGRKAYFVRPVRKKFLSWIKNGVRLFSKGHEIPPKKALHAIFDTIEKGQPKVQEELDKKTKAWYKEILKS